MKFQNKGDLPPRVEDEMYYSNPLLGTVLGLTEIIMMWGKSRRSIEIAMWKGELDHRKMISGGTILITRESVIKLWGQPTFDYTDSLLIDGQFTIGKDK